jgi:uncharacterized protein (DUF488 family)
MLSFNQVQGMPALTMETQNRTPSGRASIPCSLFSIGHGSRPAAEFLEVLVASAIDCVVDVRAHPTSRRHPQFAQKNLAALLKEAGFDYRWLGKALGGFRGDSPISIHTALTTPASRAYADHMNSAAFRAGIAELLDSARSCSAAMLCAERLPEHCHRAMISDYLTVYGVAVFHILGGEQRVIHHCNPSARWDGSRIIYDRADQQQLGWSF